MQTINGNCIFENLNFLFEGNEMLKSNMSLAVWHKSNTVMRDKLVGRNLNVLTNTSFNDISDHEQIVHIVIMNKKGSKIVGNLSLHVVLKRPISYENDNVVEVAAIIRNPAAVIDDNNHDSFSVVSEMSHFSRTTASDVKKKRSILSVFNVFKSKNSRDLQQQQQQQQQHDTHHHQANQPVGDVTMMSSTERDCDRHSEAVATVSSTTSKKSRRFFTMKRLWRTKKDS
jgi:hypothetical protein